jgi:hypothetical protein
MHAFIHAFIHSFVQPCLLELCKLECLIYLTYKCTSLQTNESAERTVSPSRLSSTRKARERITNLARTIREAVYSNSLETSRSNFKYYILHNVK